MMAVTSQSPFAPSEEKKKKKRQGLKMQLCFAKIIYELGCHEIPKFHAQIQSSSVSA